MPDHQKRLEQLRELLDAGLLDAGAYEAAIARLGLPPGMTAHVEGSGSAAQAGERAVSASAGGIAIGGDVHGDVWVGQAPANPDEALRAYRKVVVASCKHLPLRGIDVGASDPTSGAKRMELAEVYVELDTKHRWRRGKDQHVIEDGRKKRVEVYSPDAEAGERAMSAIEAISAPAQKAVLLGDPGSGKSTFVNHLCLCLAAHGLDLDAGWLDRLGIWPDDEHDHLPIAVVLRDFARSAPESERAEPHHLWDFIVGRLKAKNLAAAAAPLEQALSRGKATVILDGLDEIPSIEQRLFVRDAIAAFIEPYDDSRFVVTCRTLSYQDPQWQLGDFESFELAPLDEEKIGKFIQAWYHEQARLGSVNSEKADGLARKLQEAIRRPDLWRLAPNPLLLTVMALVHTHKGRLPEARALLYEDTVDILLWRWEELKADTGVDETPPLRQLLSDAGRSEVDLKMKLARLAFEAHRKGGGSEEELADIGEQQLQEAFRSLHPDGSLDWARDVTEAMKLRAGLLLERARGLYTFPHRTFQEYLAGAFLASQGQFAKTASKLFSEAAFWREAVLLAAGKLVYLSGDIDKPLALVGELCPEQGSGSERAWLKAWLAGDVLLEIGLNRAEDQDLGRDLAQRVRHRLAKLLEAGALSPIERARVGDSLARLGDPRFDAERGYLPLDPMFGFVEVPEGTFVMGSDKQKDEMAYEDEGPQHEVHLPSFYIGRYPVTVAQFRAFVEEADFKPGEPDCLRGTDNHPVVWVSWREALKYCEWVEHKLGTWAEGVGTDGLSKAQARFGRWAREGKLKVTLPSEAEWEKAARGTDGRIFPWGAEPDPTKANYDDTEVGTTSALGCFPGGVSPYGCLDMIGNVDEWTRTLWDMDQERESFAYPYDADDDREDMDAGDSRRRVLRGGSFASYSRYVRCAYRFGLVPVARYVSVGFRLCCAPISSGL